MVSDYKFVDFKKYCAICKHKNVPEGKEPCEECLSSPVNLHSKKPIKFEEKGV